MDIGRLDGYATEFETRPSQRKTLILNAAKSLLSDEVILLGQLRRLGRDAGLRLGFLEWAGSIDDRLVRLSALYHPGDREEAAWSPPAWVELTSRGRDLVSAMPRPSPRLFAWANPWKLDASWTATGLRDEGGSAPAGATVQQIARWLLEEFEHVGEYVEACGPRAVELALDLIDATDADLLSPDDRICSTRLDMWLHTHRPDGTVRRQIPGPARREQLREELESVSLVRSDEEAMARWTASVWRPPRAFTLSLRDGGTPNERARDQLHRLNQRVASEGPEIPIDPDSLAHLVLYRSDDDWVPIGEVDSYARHFESQTVPRKALFLETVRRLAEAG